MSTLEFGLDTFLPITVDHSGRPVSGDQVIRNAVEEAVLAEAVGIDSFNIGEHYRTEFMDSAAPVVLAAIAGRTKRIRLGTAVTVLSTQDPVRLYTDFATLDAVSNGRAPPRRLPQRPRPHRRDQRVPRRSQRRPQTLRLDSLDRLHPRKGRTL